MQFVAGYFNPEFCRASGNDYRTDVDDTDGTDVLNVQSGRSELAPGFATRVGRGLDIGTLTSDPARPECRHGDVIRCPPLLEIRQLLQYQPITTQMRTKLVDPS